MDFLTQLALMYAGNAIQSRAQNKAIQRQNESIRQGQQEQSALAQQKVDEIFRNATAFQPQNAEAALAQAVQPIQANLEGVAQQAAAESQRPVPTNASADFKAGSEARNESELARAMRMAGLQAQAQGAGRVQMSQNMANNQMASNLSNISSTMRDAAAQRENETMQAGRVNGGQMALGSALMASPFLFNQRRKIPPYTGSPEFYANGGWGSGNAFGNRDLGESL